MSPRTAAWIAWSTWGLAMVLTVLGLLLLVLNLSHPGVPVYSFWADNILLSVGFSTVGAVIVPRLPSENPVGWLFCAAGLLWGVIHLSGEYAIYTLLAAPKSLPDRSSLAFLPSTTHSGSRACRMFTNRFRG